MNHRQTLIQSLLIYCANQGVEIEKLLADSSISKKILEKNYQGEISADQLEQLWKNAANSTKDRLIGFHFGTTMQLAALNIVGTIIQSSNTVKDALQIASSFVHLLTDMYAMQIEAGSRTTLIRLVSFQQDERYPQTKKHLGDFLLTFTLYELKGLVLLNLKPIQVGLPTFSVEFETQYKQVFSCPVYKSEDYVIELANDQLNIPIISANYQLQSLLLNQVSELLNPPYLEGDFSIRIFNFLLSNSYLYSLSLDAVAGTFNMSARKLQRQLKQEGVTYIQIVEAVRKTLAIQYIKNSSSSIKEISYTLGYSEPSAFVRAFKKWTGKSPSQYRVDR